MNQFKKILNQHVKKIEQELEKVCEQETKRWGKTSPTNKEYYKKLKKFLLRGGKRLRPIAFIMACKGINPETNLKEVTKASLSIEFLHNGTLSHDDVMDEDELRRGGPTSWVMFKKYHQKKWGEKGSPRYGESMAIMQGNTFTALAFQQLINRKITPGKKIKAINYLNHYYDMVNNGQVYDITLEKQEKVNEDDYLTMTRMKTGALFEAALIIGGVIGGAEEKELKKLENYAIKMGQAFQMQDDVLGTFGSKKKFGKPTDSDIKEGKKTLMVIHALKKAKTSEKRFLQKTIGNPQASKEDVQNVRSILKKTGAVDYCKQKAKKSAQESKEYIQKSNLSQESKEFFIGLADYVLNREV